MGERFNATARAERCAALFTAVAGPNWGKLINLQTLDMGDQCGKCAASQVTGRRTYIGACVVLGIKYPFGQEAIDCGLCPSSSRGYDIEEELNELDAAFRAKATLAA